MSGTSLTVIKKIIEVIIPITAQNAPNSWNYCSLPSTTLKRSKAINKRSIFARKVNVFLLVFKISLLTLEQVKEGTREMCEIYPKAQATLKIDGKNMKKNVLNPSSSIGRNLFKTG